MAGTVIWATDLMESRTSSGGGKGKPKTVGYSYSANFAVALSARPIRTVRRIWADGKLLRGAAGDFKSATGFRLYPGDEDQAPDPLIVSAEGAGNAPAFRGIAYAVFEGFQLEDYGNRIPSLTFEIEADAGAAAIGAIAEELSAGAIVADATPALTGYAASGDSVRGAIEALADVAPLSVSDDGEKLRLSSEGGTPVPVAKAEESGRRELTRRALGTLPPEVSIVFYDSARDYQTGLQRAVRTPGKGNRPDRRSLPAALTAASAKALAEFRLASLWAGRVGAKIELGWRRCALRPGAHVRIEGETGRWKIERWTLGAAHVRLDLVQAPEAGLPDPVAANSGRPTVQPDLIHGPTTLRFHDLPLGNENGTNRPLLFAFAAGEEAGWRRAELTASFDGSGSWQSLGGTAGPATMGKALSVLGAAGSALFDDVSVLDVELLNDAMWLESRTDEALVAGANLALAGRELLQFGKAEPLGNKRFRLSRLLRGRRGTEWAAGIHEADESFILVEAGSLTSIEAPAGIISGEARLSAAGVGDGAASVTSAVEITGESLRPPSPVHLRAERTASGDLLIRWARRSRLGWSWLSGSETPLGEESEKYSLIISGPAFARAVSPAEPAYLYTAAEQAADGAAGAMRIAVAQVGTHATSRAAVLDIP